ncbi:MAG: MlaD family protein [Chitinophagales bacterium]|nr:MlaD family protein [Chitinophagales bacterium]
MKISDESKVGILAAFGLAIMIIGYSFLKGNNIFQKKFVLYAVYENTEGLNQSDLVRLNGYPVGRVSRLALGPNNRILAELQLDQDIKVTKRTVAKIESADLLGTKQISLILDSAGALVQNGDTILSEAQLDLTESVRKELLPVKQKAEAMMGSIDSILQVVQGILKGGKIESSMNNLNKATGNFAHIAQNVDELLEAEKSTISNILKNVQGITGNLNKNDDAINKIIANLGAVSDSLKASNIPATIATLDNTLKDVRSLMNKINEGEGTVGKLINDPTLYKNLEKSTASLDSLLVDLKLNPSRYVHFSVFSKKDK